MCRSFRACRSGLRWRETGPTARFETLRESGNGGALQEVLLHASQGPCQLLDIAGPHLQFLTPRTTSRVIVLREFRCAHNRQRCPVIRVFLYFRPGETTSLKLKGIEAPTSMPSRAGDGSTRPWISVEALPPLQFVSGNEDPLGGSLSIAKSAHLRRNLFLGN